MDNISPNKSKGIVTAIVLTIIAGIVLFALGIPSLRSLRNQAQAADQAKSDYSSGKIYIDAVAATYSSLTAGGLDKTLSVAAPADIDIPSALVQLDAMVAQSGLSLNSLTPSTEGGQDNINLIASGEFGQLQSFLKLVESNLRPFDIESVAVNSYEADGKILTAGTFEVILSKKTPGSTSSQSTTSNESVTVSSGE